MHQAGHQLSRNALLTDAPNHSRGTCLTYGILRLRAAPPPSGPPLQPLTPIKILDKDGNPVRNDNLTNPAYVGPNNNQDEPPEVYTGAAGGRGGGVEGGGWRVAAGCCSCQAAPWCDQLAGIDAGDGPRIHPSLPLTPPPPPPSLTQHTAQPTQQIPRPFSLARPRS